MNQLILTPAQARKIILHAAGLSKRAPFGKGREAVYKLIDHLGYVQIDANYVVERAHHHAIASRVPDYKPEWLDEVRRRAQRWTLHPAKRDLPLQPARTTVDDILRVAALLYFYSPTPRVFEPGAAEPVPALTAQG